MPGQALIYRFGPDTTLRLGRIDTDWDVRFLFPDIAKGQVIGFLFKKKF